MLPGLHAHVSAALSTPLVPDVRTNQLRMFRPDPTNFPAAFSWRTICRLLSFLGSAGRETRCSRGCHTTSGRILSQLIGSYPAQQSACRLLPHPSPTRPLYTGRIFLRAFGLRDAHGLSGRWRSRVMSGRRTLGKGPLGPEHAAWWLSGCCHPASAASWIPLQVVCFVGSHRHRRRVHREPPPPAGRLDSHGMPGPRGEC